MKKTTDGYKFLYNLYCHKFRQFIYKSECLVKGDTCVYTIYLIDSKPMYVNKMTGCGVHVWNYISRKVIHISEFSLLPHLFLTKVTCCALEVDGQNMKTSGMLECCMLRKNGRLI